MVSARARGVVTVVLAAGNGSRFGTGPHKLARTLAERSVLATTLAVAQAAGLPMVVVTIAPLLALVQGIVAADDIVLLPPVGAPVREPLGMGYSLAVGVVARAQAAGWVVLPGDMPLVRPSTLRAVADALPFHPVAYAQHHGRRGHPVGFGSELYSELVRLGGDEGARRLITRYPAHAVAVDDPGVLVDIDTPAALAAARAALGLAPAAGADS